MVTEISSTLENARRAQCARHWQNTGNRWLMRPWAQFLFIHWDSIWVETLPVTADILSWFTHVCISGVMRSGHNIKTFQYNLSQSNISCCQHVTVCWGKGAVMKPGYEGERIYVQDTYFEEKKEVVLDFLCSTDRIYSQNVCQQPMVELALMKDSDTFVIFLSKYV